MRLRKQDGQFALSNMHTRSRFLFISSLTVILGTFIFVALPLSAHAAFPTAAESLGASSPSSAPVKFVPLIPTPDGSPFARIFGEGSTLTGFFNGLFSLSITIGALLAVLMIAYGGWHYMTSEIGGKKEEARRRIWNAVLGLLMLLATVLILRQINPDIVSLSILTPPTISHPYSESSSSDPGVLYTRPEDSGGFCYYIGTGNPHASEYDNYVCFRTLLACGERAGTFDACSPYGTAITDSDHGGYVLPAGAEDYSQLAYTYPGLDGSGNLRSCNDPTVKGPGWVNLAANYCGALSIGPGQCCGLPKDYTPTTPPTTTGEKFGVDEQQYIPAGNSCYIDNTNTYTCFSERNKCLFDLSIAIGTHNASNSSKCLVRTATQSWSDPDLTSTLGEEEEFFNVSDLSYAAAGSWCYNAGSYFCSKDENTCTTLASARKSANPSATITACFAAH